MNVKLFFSCFCLFIFFFFTAFLLFLKNCFNPIALFHTHKNGNISINIHSLYGVSDEHLKPIIVSALYFIGKGTPSAFHLKMTYQSQIMLIIMLISSWIINELGKFWQISVKQSLLDICMYTDILKFFFAWI